MALGYARISYELTQLIENSAYESENDEFNNLCKILKVTPGGLSLENLQDLVERYQALSLSIEFFCFHYFTDHFASGHCAFVGDLRAELPKRFGVFGSILASNLHDELSRGVVYMTRPYDPTPDSKEPPIVASGDDYFDERKNYYNHKYCIDGMTRSLDDLHQVFQGNPVPEQKNYGGLEFLPDVDRKYRQLQPLILMGPNQKIFYRTNLSEIKTLSPLQVEATFKAPAENGYTELSSTAQAFALVFKLRVLPFIYSGKLQVLSAEQLKQIELEEAQLNPGRNPIPTPPLSPTIKVIAPPATPVDEPIAPPSSVIEGSMEISLASTEFSLQTPGFQQLTSAGLRMNGLFSQSSVSSQGQSTVEQNFSARF